MDINDLIASLNALTSYPTVADLHNLSQQLQAFSASDITTQLLPALTNLTLVNDIKLLMTGNLPSLITAPIPVMPVLPTAPNYDNLVRTMDAGAATNSPPQVLPQATPPMAQQ
jgi:hypothetical protein